MATTSQKVIGIICKMETPLKKLAEKAVRPLLIPHSFPGGTRIHARKMTGTIWGEPYQLTISLLKTDVFDRRFAAGKPFTVDEIVKGAFSEANKDFDDMPHSGLVRATWGALVEEGGRRDFEVWSRQYPFPCIKPVGQVIVRADDMQTAGREGKQSLSDGIVSIHMENTGSVTLDLKYLMAMKRNITAIDVKYRNIKEKLCFKLYRHQDQGHRKYMDENGNYIPKKERLVVHTPSDPAKPLEYYDLEADADINGPFEPPKSGADGRFFWISQKFPAEPTFPDGFEYVMMGLVSETGAEISRTGLQKGLGTNPYVPKGPSNNVIHEKGTEGYRWMYTEKSCESLRDALGTAATAILPEAGTGRVQLYVSVVTTNETKDIFAEARKQLLEAEGMGFEGLVKENKGCYDALYDRREEGRITVSASGDEKGCIDTMLIYDAFKSWAIHDKCFCDLDPTRYESSKTYWFDASEEEKGRIDEILINDIFRSWALQDAGYCDPDPDKYEADCTYAAFDLDTQIRHGLPCYNEVFPEPRMVRNRHEPLLYYCRLVKAWYEGLKGKAQAIYGLPGIVLPNGFLPPAKPDPWYIENQALDLCLDISGEVMMALWLMWDYRADEEMLKNLIYPAIHDLAIFYEAFARRNYDGRYYNLIPVVENENWGISYRLKHTMNTTAAITMFRKILNCAIEGAELLGIDADRIPGWREVAENLPPYAKYLVGGGGILAGNPGAMPRWSSGDHPIFTADYPAVLSSEINLDSPQEEKDLIARTNDVVRTNGWNRIGYILVGKFKDDIPSTINNGAILIENGKMLMEELLLRPERLMNSRSGRIHLFPVLPDWSEVAFHDFQARGGFIVSAAKGKDGVKAVMIKARRSIPCRIMNPWAGKDKADPTICKKVMVTDITAEKTVKYGTETDNGVCIVFPAEAGHEYSIDCCSEFDSE